MLFSTSLVTVVPLPDASARASSAQRLNVINTKRQSTICELSFPTPVLHVHMNRRRLVVVLQGALFVYDISNMKLLHTVETAPNATGLCALSPSSDQCYMAYAGPLAGTTDGAASSGTGTGTVVLYDLLTLSVAGVVAAHRSPVACLAFNASGTMLATASEKGTVVGVFSVPDGAPLYQFRRGSYAAHIGSITFNAASTLLCVTSDTGTVHLFQLTHTRTHDTAGDAVAPPAAHTEHASPRRSASLRNAWRRPSALVGSVGGYLPTSLAGMWEPARDFAHIKLPNPGVRAIAAVSKYVVAPLTRSLPAQVMVLTMDGHFYVYALDLEHGGECVLTKRTTSTHSRTEYSLLDGIMT